MYVDDIKCGEKYLQFNLNVPKYIACVKPQSQTLFVVKYPLVSFGIDLKAWRSPSTKFVICQYHRLYMRPGSMTFI